MTRPLLVVSCLIFACITPAFAGLDARNGEIGFDVGYAHLDPDVAAASDGGRFTFRGGYCFTQLFELEGEGVGIGSKKTGGVDVTTGIGINFVDAVFNFHPRSKGIVPYVLGGLGYGTTTIDLDPGGKVDDSGGAWQIAAGSRFFFGGTKRVAVRVELALLGIDTFDDSTTNSSVTAGFTWRIGDPKQ
jgi:hypothetical protein